MSDKSVKANKLLKGAYALRTSADNTRYYREFAPIYDEQFAEALGYSYPQAVANVYKLQHSEQENIPILDVGCGTGLVAEALGVSGAIDGVDLSAEMLTAAVQKNVYRSLYCHDLTTGVDALPGNYGGVVSAGTFTHGHLGPQVLEKLLEVGRAGALYCLGINAAHYQNAGFKRVLERLTATGLISGFNESVQDIYAGSKHSGENKAIVAIFRKTSD